LRDFEVIDLSSTETFCLSLPSIQLNVGDGDVLIKFILFIIFNFENLELFSLI